MPLAAVAAVGLAAAGAAGAFSPDSPDPLNYSQITSDTLQTQLRLLPQFIKAHAKYDPITLASQQRLAWNQLFGTPEGDSMENYTEQHEYTPAQYAAAWRARYGYGASPAGTRTYRGVDNGANMGMPGATGNSGTPSLEQMIKDLGGKQYNNVQKQRMVHQDAAPGMLELMEKAAPQLNALQSGQRAADIADVTNLGPEAFKAIHDYDTDGSGLLDELTKQVSDDLKLNGQLDPFLTRQLQQNIRAGQAARGMGYGQNDANAEGYYITSTAENRRRQNQAAAASTVGTRNSYYGDPFVQVLSRTSGRQPVLPYTYTGGSIVPGGVDPNGYRLAMQNQNMQWDHNVAANQSMMSGMNLIPGAITGLGNTFSGMNWGNLFGSQSIPNNASI